MKFLLNMNVPRKLGRRLTSEGHECRHVGDIGMAQVSDFRCPSYPKIAYPRRSEINYLSLPVLNKGRNEMDRPFPKKVLYNGMIDP